MCNVELFGEGFDLPALECVICLRPTQSLAFWLQMCGRALRVFPGKEYAVILDHAGNVERHGLPDDERIWTLEGRSKKSRDGEGRGGSRTKACPFCKAVKPVAFVKCTNCGYVETPGVDPSLAFGEGDLVEVDAATVRLKRAHEQAQAGSLAELIELGRRRGYKSPQQWAENVFAARLRRDRMRGDGL